MYLITVLLFSEYTSYLLNSRKWGWAKHLSELQITTNMMLFGCLCSHLLSSKSIALYNMVSTLPLLSLGVGYIFLSRDWENSTQTERRKAWLCLFTLTEHVCKLSPERRSCKKVSRFSRGRLNLQSRLFTSLSLWNINSPRQLEQPASKRSNSSGAHLGGSRDTRDTGGSLKLCHVSAVLDMIIISAFRMRSWCHISQGRGTGVTKWRENSV